MVVTIQPYNGCDQNVIDVVKEIVGCSLEKATEVVNIGRIHCPTTMGKELAKKLSTFAKIRTFEANEDAEEQNNVPMCVEEVPQSEIMVASEIDEDTNESITVVLCLITPSTETVEKFKNNRKRMSGILPIVGSVVPQIRRIVMGTIVNDDKETLMVALASPSCAIALDKATQLGEFAEAIGKAILDFVDNDFNEARIRAIAKDLSSLYED